MSTPALMAAALAFACPAPPPPTIHIDLATEAVALDRARSLADLARLKSPGPQHYTGGLYTATLQAQGETIFNLTTDRIWTCISVGELRVRLAAQARTINVAREFPAGSCEANAVLEHERRHQAADDNLLARAVPALRAALIEASRGMAAGPIPAGEAQRTQAKLQAQVNDVLHREVDRLTQEREQTQRAVDSPAEYTRVQALCPGGWRQVR